MDKKELVKKKFAGLIEKRINKNLKRTKYTREEKTPEEYKELKVKINGKDKNLSQSSKFFLDIMSVEGGPKSSLELVDGNKNKQITEISDYMLDMVTKE